MSATTEPPLPRPTEAQLRTIRNERLKWLAAAVERAGTGAFIAGWATPLVAYSLDMGGLAHHSKPTSLGAVMPMTLGIGLLLWVVAYRILGGIRS